jgi:glycosyltransferase involved in cell wall biosynthesis
MSPRSVGYSGRQLLPRIKFFVYDYFIKFFIPVYEFKNRVNHCVINSSYTAKLFEKAYNKKINVVHPSNLVKISKPIDYEAKDTVIFLSRIVRYKRPEMLIKLAALYENIQFEIIGAPEDEAYVNELNTKINSENLSNIKILSNLPYNALVEHLYKAKFYVFTAKDEHFGITTVEAMMYGVIPFVHNSGGQMEIVPFDELRFEDEDFVSKFDLLINKNEQDLTILRTKVLKHSANFGESVFIDKMLKFVNRA